ncbi:hypothetical protein HMPREF0872_07890 [Veillonella montpellierensis DNF00314]|uniref:Uncharacterized protein n=1 Tax=Veillonella montpellierensis DNF00314 TaxID=1401067 RepID=A0A096CMJ8_9FIRM|nr:hypothetical protein [Veillonella montpellierensis]KGF46549.1 hypothetical protein HMPREF0872_07890 [Veillonella montpellierensis DNF00314]
MDIIIGIIIMIIGTLVFTKKGNTSSTPSDQQQIDHEPLTWEEMEAKYGIHIEREDESLGEATEITPARIDEVPASYHEEPIEEKNNTSFSTVDVHRMEREVVTSTQSDTYTSVRPSYKISVTPTTKLQVTKPVTTVYHVQSRSKQHTAVHSNDSPYGISLKTAKRGIVWSTVLERPKGLLYFQRMKYKHHM